MTRNQWWRTSAAFIATMGLMQPTTMFAADARPALEIGPRSSPLVAAQTLPAGFEPKLTHEQKLDLLQHKIKYVFVLFQENRSFEQHFGTFPGAVGLFSQPASQTPGFTQQIVNVDNTVGTVQPFLLPQTVIATTGATVPIYPMDTDSVDHSHTGIVNDIHYTNGVTLNDRYALNAEGLTTDANGNIVSRTTGAPYGTLPPPSLSAKQHGELVMSHLDCDTVPFLWQYADRFTMFDNFHMTITSASTPNAIALISGQTGLTQWALHPDESSANLGSPVVVASGGVPDVTDAGPFAGSNLDYSPVKPVYGPFDVSPASPTLNQTYASLPLSFMGKTIYQTIQSDQNPALDLADVQSDIKAISVADKPVSWGWYQEGYDHEPTDGTGAATHASYITHHNGPQYFGYIGDNTAEQSNLHGLGDFFTAVSASALPAKGGVFYVRGGYNNNDGLKPVDPNPTVQTNFVGSDDHPGYSDTQIAESLLADEINAIAASPYWSQSAIIITYDETDGLYDHVPESIRVNDPEGNPLSGGPRIPAIVISPYASVHAISHQYSEHSSVIKFIDELFHLVPLENLPNEKQGRALGMTQFNQANITPVDAEPYMGDLFEAFDNARLTGKALPLAPSYAEIPASVVASLPHYGGKGCYTLNIVPTDYVGGKLLDPAPVDFNPRPSTTPGTPTSGTWTP